MEKDERRDGPLSSEALKRDEWRGDHEKDEGSSDEAGGGSGPNPIAGTMLPPD